MITFEEFIYEKYSFEEVNDNIPWHNGYIIYEFENIDGVRFKVMFIENHKEKNKNYTREYRIINGSPFSELNSGDAIGILKTVTNITLDFIKKYEPYSITIEHIPTREEYKKHMKNPEMVTKRAIANKRFLERDLPSNYNYELKGMVSKIIKKDFLNENTNTIVNINILKIVNKFISLYKNPLDINQVLDENGNLSDIVIDLIEDENLSVNKYLKKVVNKIIETNPDYGEVWKEF